MSNKINTCKVASYVAIDKLKAHPNNPRRIEQARLEDLKRSIKALGFYQPILVSKKTGVVLSGNHRLLAARELVKEGYDFVTPGGKKNLLPVVLETVDRNNEMAILIGSNTVYADWIDSKLEEAIKELKDPSIVGFTQDEIDRLLIDATEDVEKELKKRKEEKPISNDDDDLFDDVPSDDFDDDVPAPKVRVQDKQRFDSISARHDVIADFKAILARLSKDIDPEWQSGDDISEALEGLCVLINEDLKKS